MSANLNFLSHDLTASGLSCHQAAAGSTTAASAAAVGLTSRTPGFHRVNGPSSTAFLYNNHPSAKTTTADQGLYSKMTAGRQLSGAASAAVVTTVGSAAKLPRKYNAIIPGVRVVIC